MSGIKPYARSTPGAVLVHLGVSPSVVVRENVVRACVCVCESEGMLRISSGSMRGRGWRAARATAGDRISRRGAVGTCGGVAHDVGPADCGVGLHAQSCPHSEKGSIPCRVCIPLARERCAAWA